MLKCYIPWSHGNLYPKLIFPLFFLITTIVISMLMLIWCSLTIPLSWMSAQTYPRTVYTNCSGCAALAHHIGLLQLGLLWLLIFFLSDSSSFLFPTVEIHSQFVLSFQVNVDPGTPPSLTLKRKLNTKDSVLAEFDLTLKEKISMVLFWTYIIIFQHQSYWYYCELIFFSCISFSVHSCGSICLIALFMCEISSFVYFR